MTTHSNIDTATDSVTRGEDLTTAGQWQLFWLRFKKTPVGGHKSGCDRQPVHYCGAGGVYCAF